MPFPRRSSSTVRVRILECRSARSKLRRESFNHPPAFAPRIAKPIVQTARTALPELNYRRRYTVDSPIGRQRDPLAFILSDEFVHLCFKHFAAGDNLALI